MKVQSPDQSICPVCGESNACSLVERGSGRTSREKGGDAFQCWCMAYPKIELNEPQSDTACLCAKCLKEKLDRSADGEKAFEGM